MRKDLCFLWDILESTDHDICKSHADFLLSAFLGTAGYSLIHVKIESAVMEYRNSGRDVHYLGAEISVRYPDGTFHTHMLRPRYEGSDDEWRRLMMGVGADDLIIRFSLGRRRLEPLWTSAVFQRGRIDLTGERLDWTLMDEDDSRRCRYLHSYTSPEDAEREADPAFHDVEWVTDRREYYDDMMEALDPDYDSSENPYLDCYWDT